jgi:DNA-binding NtrC family response regulator
MNEPTRNRGRSAAPRVLLVQPDVELRRPVLVGRTIAKVERNLILCTLEHCRGNRTHAATILGISVRTLRNKLRKYDTNVPRELAAQSVPTTRRSAVDASNGI